MIFLMALQSLSFGVDIFGMTDTNALHFDEAPMKYSFIERLPSLLDF